MRRLSGWDTIHLQVETEKQTSNVLGLVHLARQRDAETVAADLVRKIRDAVERLSPLRQVVRQVPWDPDLPVWSSSTSFRVSDHVIPHEVTGFDDVRRHAETLAATPLDRSRPLWAVHIYHDVQGGEVYAIWLMHHCAIDAPLGKAMLALVSGMVDASALGDLEAFLTDQPLSDRQIVIDGFRRRINKFRRFPGLLWRTIAMAREWFVRARDGSGLPMLFSGGRTSLNTTMNVQRRLAFFQVHLGELSTAAEHFGCSLNDILLTSVSGALRAELIRRGEPVDGSHTVMQPNVVDYDDDEFVTTGANTVSALIAGLHTDIPDVSARLTAINREMKACKAHHAALGANWSRAWSEYTGRIGLPQVIRTIERLRVADWTAPIYTVLCANVNGTDIPAVFFGYPIQALYPVGALYHGTGVSIGAWSVGSWLNVSVLAAGSALGTVTDFEEDMKAQFDEIFQEAGRAGRA